jgi:hypothetical protein
MTVTSEVRKGRVPGRRTSFVLPARLFGAFAAAQADGLTAAVLIGEALGARGYTGQVPAASLLEDVVERALARREREAAAGVPAGPGDRVCGNERCGRLFTPGRSDAVYCSGSCRAAAGTRRHKARVKAAAEAAPVAEVPAGVPVPVPRGGGKRPAGKPRAAAKSRARASRVDAAAALVASGDRAGAAKALRSVPPGTPVFQEPAGSVRVGYPVPAAGDHSGKRGLR